MSEPKNPLVFPTGDHNNIQPQDGITLRDYFAAKAMQAFLSQCVTENENLSNPDGRKLEDWVASDAYLIADGMLAARSRSDFTKDCKCGDESTGAMWCCNICGHPKTSDK